MARHVDKPKSSQLLLGDGVCRCPHLVRNVKYIKHDCLFVVVLVRGIRDGKIQYVDYNDVALASVIHEELKKKTAHAL